MKYSKPKNLEEEIFNILEEDVKMTDGIREALNSERGSGDMLRNRLEENRLVFCRQIINLVKSYKEIEDGDNKNS